MRKRVLTENSEQKSYKVQSIKQKQRTTNVEQKTINKEEEAEKVQKTEFRAKTKREARRKMHKIN